LPLPIVLLLSSQNQPHKEKQIRKKENPPCQLSWRVGCLSLSNFVSLSSVKPSGQDAGKAYYYVKFYNPQIVTSRHAIEPL
jgi:hypothetical protein